MLEVLGKAAAFIAVIALGYALKRISFFELKDFYLVSKVVVHITLPCVIITNFSNLDIAPSMLILCAIGFGCNGLYDLLGYLANRRGTREEKAFGIINASGFNIGNFTLPFIQSFLGPTGVAACSLFDAGNALMCTGFTYSIASAVQGKDGKVTLKSMARDLFSSFPFDTYLIMMTLGLLHWRLPAPILSFAQTAGSANPFLALLMIGIGFDIRLDKSKWSRLIRMLLVRYGTALILSLCFYYLLPFDREICQTLAITAFGPVSSVATAYTGALGGDVELSSAMNSISIIVSVVCMTLLLMVL